MKARSLSLNFFFFRNIILFIERLRDVIFIKSFFIIKTNLNIALKDTILL